MKRDYYEVGVFSERNALGVGCSQRCLEGGNQEALLPARQEVPPRSEQGE